MTSQWARCIAAVAPLKFVPGFGALMMLGFLGARDVALWLAGRSAGVDGWIVLEAALFGLLFATSTWYRCRQASKRASDGGDRA